MQANKTLKRNQREPIYRDGEILCWITSDRRAKVQIDFPEEEQPRPMVAEACADEPIVEAETVDSFEGKAVG